MNCLGGQSIAWPDPIYSTTSRRTISGDRFIPKGLNHSAQGCPACGATLGMLPQKTVNPERVEACVNPKQTVHRIQWHTDVTMFGIPPEMMFCYDAVAGP